MGRIPGVLFVTESPAGEQLRVHAICRSLDIDDAAVVDEGAALARLRTQREVVLLDVEHPQARSLVARVRADRDLHDLVVLALTRDLSAEGLSRPLSWGADAAMPTDALPRLSALVRAAAGPSQGEPSGAVTLGFFSQEQRLLRAGVLRAAGYRSQFCGSFDELRWCVDDPRGDLFVVEGAMLGSPAALAELQARDPARRPWAVVVPEAELGAWRGVREGVALVTADAPLTDALHRALTVRPHPVQEIRASPRLHYASAMRYTLDGLTAHALSFNIARDGLYVRTPTPPARGAVVALELTPPGSLATVRVEGAVAWSKPFGSRAFASSPAGFGVAITGGDEGQLLRWRRGYERLRAGG